MNTSLPKVGFPNFQESHAFLQLLDPDTNQFTFQTFDDNSSRKTNDLARMLHGTLEQHASILMKLQTGGAGIFITVNRTDLRGRKADNIIGIRAIYADFDIQDEKRIEKLPQILGEFEPSIIVESSPGKHHYYWLVQDLKIEEFTDIQIKISSWLESDPHIKDLSRVMRLPGFWHLKGEPFQSRIIHNSGKTYDRNTVYRILEAHSSNISHKLPASNSASPDFPKSPYINTAFQSARDAVTNATEGNRNLILNTEAFGLFGLVKSGYLHEQEVRESLKLAARTSGLSETEIDKTLNSAYNAATPRHIESVNCQKEKPHPTHQQSTVIKPLPIGLPPVMRFDPEMLPPTIREYVMDIADRVQCPPDFVAVAAVCGLSAVLGRKVLIRPKQLDNWTVTPTQWGALIGVPSTRKSPSMQAALKPLLDIEADAIKQYRKDLKQYKVKAKLADIEVNKALKDVSNKKKKEEKDKALSALMESQFDDISPTCIRKIVNDSTVEKLGALLEENPNGLLLNRDELGGWIAKMMQEENQSERAFYLECFDGNGRFTYDRIQRGTIAIENCILSVIGGIQPSKIAPLLRGAVKGTADDGLIQRLQLIAWPDNIKKRSWKDQAPNKAAFEQYRNTFIELDELKIHSKKGNPPYLHFSNVAQDLFIKWYEKIHDEACNEDVHPVLESHLLKMPKTIAGLALLFELVEGGRDDVGEASLNRALKWSEYLCSQYNRLYSSILNGDVEGANTILKRRRKLPKIFTARDVRRKGWAGLYSIESVTEALECLVEHNYLHAISSHSTGGGGRPTNQYFWNPALDNEEKKA